MKRFLVQIVILAFLIGCLPVSASQADSGDSYTDAQCVECHEDKPDDHAASVHKDIECLECHTQAAEEDHEEMPSVDCRQCHAPHDEKSIHDAHTRVACNACHIKGGVPAAEPGSDRIIWSGTFRPGSTIGIHQALRPQGEELCAKCHFQGNSLGAASMILPAKSILCMPCHVATFSVSDTTTLVSLFIFLIGIIGLCAVWFSATLGFPIPSFEFRDLFSGKFAHLLNTLIFDVFLLQRFFRLSPVRWIIHALIFFPFLFRFIFGLTALLLSIYLPDWPLSVAMLDKNHAVRACFFDLTGIMILTGVALAIGRERKAQIEASSLPEPGWAMPVLLGLIVLAGFILEGLRIAMTGWPAGTEWAFLGYGVSLMFKGMTGLTDTYGYVWYLHAILVGTFIALIPFTRMSHIITAPISLIVNARAEAHANIK
ncbi:respiratory nitrate reductase subunit gamma [Desulfococcaceae bacterium HSG7]|nr:respiratory nitrate reductase subunit gamma [Desulfococcaceae bacterium HSG7]